MKRRIGLLIAVCLVTLFAGPAALGGSYPVPFFTGDDADASGVFTDAGGNGWKAITINDFGQTFAQARGMKWVAGENRWVGSNSDGTLEFPQNGTYEAGPAVQHPAATNQSAFPAIAFIAGADGTYSVQGTALVSGQRPRMIGQLFSGGAGATVLADSFASNDPLTASPIDFGAYASWQDLDLAAGDAIAIHFYTLLDPGGVDGVLDLSGVQIVPEPASLALIGLGAIAAMRRRRN